MGKVVAVVDDDEGILEVITKALQKLDGVKIRCFRNGREFLEALKNERFDAGIVDWRLANPLGSEVASAMLTRGIPVMAVSGFKEVQRECREAGVNEFLSKPFPVAELIKKTLHLAGLNEVKATYSIPSDLKKALKDKKVLVVDDDKDTLDLYILLLEKADCFPCLATNTDSAGKWLEYENKPDIVLLDITLRGSKMNGIELCRTIKKNPSTRHIPVVITTAHSGNEARIQADEAGAEMYLTKVFKAEDLYKAMALALAKKEKINDSAKDKASKKGGVELEPKSLTVSYRNKSIQLPKPYFGVVEKLIENHPKAVTRAALAGGKIIQDRSIDTRVSRINKTFKKHFGQEFIISVPQVGYRWQTPD